MATTTASIALQALAVVTAAVALQQYSRVRTQSVAAAQRKKEQAAKAHAAAAAEQKSDSTEAFVVEIEYCTGCRWMLRAAWLGQELLTTFQNDLRSVKLTPNSNQGGVFQVYVYDENANDSEKELLWSRKAVGRFPESKELKQIVRDFIRPDKGLGHSDKK